MIAEWAWKTRGSVQKYMNYETPTPGCASLIKMAVRSFLIHSPTIATSSLVGLPWELGSLLWDNIVLAQLDSVKVWQAFASAYPDAPCKTVKRRSIHIPNQSLPLNLYTEPMLSIATHWLAILTLENITLPRSTLIQCLSRLTNLAVLTLGTGLACDPGVGLDDNVIRAWGRHAKESDNGQAFGLLKVLNMRWQPSITSRAFVYLQPLPRLAVVNVHRCGIPYDDIHVARDAGWSYHSPDDTPSAVFERADKVGFPNWDSIAHASLKLATTLGESTVASKGAAATDDLPRLHLMLGRTQGLPANVGGRKMDGEMMAFVRDPQHRTETDGRLEGNHKRHRSDSDAPARKSRKRSNIRFYKQPEMYDVLRSFAS